MVGPIRHHIGAGVQVISTAKKQGWSVLQPVTQDPGGLQRFLTQPFAVTEAFTGKPGRSVSLAETLKGCHAILSGIADTWAESSLYMVGTIDEARDKEKAASQKAKTQ